MTENPKPEAADSQDDLDRSALFGVAWSGAAKWSTQILSWAGTILVARILSPSDIGLLTTASVFMGVVMMLSEFGIGTAIVTLRELPEEHIGQLHTFSILMGLGGTLITALMAVPLGAFFRAPELPPVLAVVGLTFFITGWQTVPGALLRRQMRFRTIAGIDFVRGVLVPAVTLGGALAGMRYWALAMGSVVGALITSGLTLYQQRVSFAWPRLRGLKAALSYSSDVLLGRLAWMVYQNGDFAVAGRMLSMAAVGAYGMAWTLATSPIEKVTMVVGDVTPAVFSSAQHDQAAFRRYFLNLSEVLCIATFPAATGLALVSHDAVAVLLGDKWEAAAAPLAVLALTAGARSVTSVFGHVFNAARETRFAMWTSMVLSAILLVGFVLGSAWGPTGIAAAWLLVHPTFSVFIFGRVKRVLDLPALTYLRVLRLGLDGTAAMAAVLLTFHYFVASTWSPLLRLPVKIALGAAVFAVTTKLLHGQRLREIVAWVQRVRGAGVESDPDSVPA